MIDLRDGDIVNLKAIVREVRGQFFSSYIIHPNDRENVTAALAGMDVGRIVSVDPRPVQVGDIRIHKTNHVQYKVLAVYGMYVCIVVLDDAGMNARPITVFLDNLI